jgi:DNA-binding MarR family transcriptional regulator
MSTSPPFGTQLIGQTENAFGAILDRQLTGTGLTRPQWIALTIAVMSGASVDHAQLVSRLAEALKLTDAEAQAHIHGLTAADLLELSQAEGSVLSVTGAGRELHAQIRTAVTEITERLWGDMPADEVATAGRVLGRVLERANAELARPWPESSTRG